MTMRSRAKVLVDIVLRPTGFQLIRIPDHSGFYPTVPTCQIPTLSSLFERFFNKRTDGTFVEVGAFDGFTYSNTWGLAEKGWEGLLIEPIPEHARKCRDNHKNHPNIRIAQTAIGDRRGFASRSEE